MGNMGILRSISFTSLLCCSLSKGFHRKQRLFCEILLRRRVLQTTQMPQREMLKEMILWLYSKAPYCFSPMFVPALIFYAKGESLWRRFYPCCSQQRWFAASYAPLLLQAERTSRCLPWTKSIALLFMSRLRFLLIRHLRRAEITISSGMYLYSFDEKPVAIFYNLAPQGYAILDYANGIGGLLLCQTYSNCCSNAY